MYNVSEEPTVVPMQAPSPPAPIDYSHVISIIATWKDILNARLLAVLALAGALGVYGVTIYDPTPPRLIGAALYSLVLWPVLLLFNRKG
jgi:hypothetical protein